MKYSKEFKLECVMKYKNGECIKDPPEVSHRIFHDQVRKWVRQYNSLGEFAFDHNKPTLSTEERVGLIIRVENGESYKSVAYSAGIQPDLLIKWHKIYRQEGIEGLQSLKRGKSKMNNKPKIEKSLDEMSDKEKIKYYQEQLEYYKAENAYLKKLRALVQSKQDQQRKKE